MTMYYKFDYMTNYNVGKILVCKDDSALNTVTLQTLANCQTISELEFDNQYIKNVSPDDENLHKTDDIVLIYNINFAYKIVDCKDISTLRFFKVDDSATSQLLSDENYFVGALHFDESSLKGLMLCNSISCCSEVFTNLFDQYVDDNDTSSEEEIDKINELIGNFDDDLYTETMKKLHGYIVNTW
jgi:hypothetical protein